MHKWRHLKLKTAQRPEFCNSFGPKLLNYYYLLVSQMADFAIGGIFLGPKIRQFRELTVICIFDGELHLFISSVENDLRT